jgi:hypothetical protein
VFGYIEVSCERYTPNIYIGVYTHKYIGHETANWWGGMGIRMLTLDVKTSLYSEDRVPGFQVLRGSGKRRREHQEMFYFHHPIH